MINKTDISPSEHEKTVTIYKLREELAEAKGELVMASLEIDNLKAAIKFDVLLESKVNNERIN